ncbi:putative proline-rich receptor-like protein kinase PERK13 [Iris pallida]|uniref:Proline-rich receptor-like protein kinase PERK13 n=1 Tax=Iris pallida TaxID=29817 RepID=A0AAX6HKY0_IRIPA|nr:putative proline-rich receptor-like protein kinase PERK13 [Iris pallida]
MMLGELVAQCRWSGGRSSGVRRMEWSVMVVM